MEGFWEYLFLVWIIGVILRVIAAENVKITTILTTFLTGYALGVASILRAIYCVLLPIVNMAPGYKDHPIPELLGEPTGDDGIYLRLTQVVYEKWTTNVRKVLGAL
eukprot:3940283-Rhodomonas_salina.3